MTMSASSPGRQRRHAACSSFSAPPASLAREEEAPQQQAVDRHEAPKRLAGVVKMMSV